MSELVGTVYYCRKCRLLFSSSKVRGVKCPECHEDLFVVEYFMCSNCREKFGVKEASRNGFKCPNCGASLMIFYNRIT